RRFSTATRSPSSKQRASRRWGPTHSHNAKPQAGTNSAGGKGARRNERRHGRYPSSPKRSVGSPSSAGGACGARSSESAKSTRTAARPTKAAANQEERPALWLGLRRNHRKRRAPQPDAAHGASR